MELRAQILCLERKASRKEQIKIPTSAWRAMRMLPALLLFNEFSVSPRFISITLEQNTQCASFNGIIEFFAPFYSQFVKLNLN
jgi:hypothetical protein